MRTMRERRNARKRRQNWIDVGKGIGLGLLFSAGALAFATVFAGIACTLASTCTM